MELWQRNIWLQEPWAAGKYVEVGGGGRLAIRLRAAMRVQHRQKDQRQSRYSDIETNSPGIKSQLQ